MTSLVIGMRRYPTSHVSHHPVPSLCYVILFIYFFFLSIYLLIIYLLIIYLVPPLRQRVRRETGYWSDPNNRRKFLCQFAASMRFDPFVPENWNHVPLSKLVQYKVIQYLPYLVQKNELTIN